MTKLRSDLEEEIRDLYLNQNKSDKEIAALKGVSDVAVSYFRKKHGIQTKSQLGRNVHVHTGPSFLNITAAELSSLYASMGFRGIAKLYGVSKTAVSRKCKELGIGTLSKSDRSCKNTPFTEEQREALIGSLLGDGHLLDRGVFKVTHYQEQIAYLRQLHRCLFPHALPLYYEEKVMENGRLTFAFGFRTTQHEWLKTLRGVFYREGRKVFPFNILRNLSARSLAYWYFDDGHLDDTVSIALGNITNEEAQRVVSIVSERFGLDLYVKGPGTNCKSLGVRATSTGDFFRLVRKFCSSDMLYKLPVEHREGLDVRIPVRTEDPYLLPRGLIDEAKRWSSLSNESEKSEVVEIFARFWEGKGFPHHVPRPEELNALINLDSAQVLKGRSIKPVQVGQAICQGICTHIWQARSFECTSPKEIFLDPLKLRDIIRFCLDSGSVPNASKLRSALRYWKRSGVYNFRPSAAKALVDLYCPSGGLVLDPCAGYGGRFLGTVLSKASARYVGIEPATETFDALGRLNQWLTSYLPRLRGRATLYKAPAEDVEFPQGVDMVMTSPPYWKREVYSLEETQSSCRYSTYAEWLEGFWRKVLLKSLEALKAGGWLVLNVDDFTLQGQRYSLIDDTIRLVGDMGLGAPERMVYELPGNNSEAVLVWAKGFGFRHDHSNAAILRLPSCRSCGKAFPRSSLRKGLCRACLGDRGHDLVCKGCGCKFQSTRRDRQFHSHSCYAIYRRRQKRNLEPVSIFRTFTCVACGLQWQTEQLGSFKLCSGCKIKRQKDGRQKVCAYNGCGRSFADTSPKKSMRYCCSEHRDRQKRLRLGR